MGARRPDATADGDLSAALRRSGVSEPPDRGLSDRVGEVYVMLTWRCTLRCRMCPMWGERGFCGTNGAGDERLEIEPLLAFLRGARERGLRTITLSGGEPLLSPLCLPLARRLGDEGFRVALTTNATGLADLGGAELRAFHQVNVSLDGPAHVLQALRRGGEATLQRALDGVRRARDARQDGRPRIRLLTVITPEGVGQLDALVARFVDERLAPDDVVFQHALFCDERAAREQRAALERLVGPGVGIWDAMVAPPDGVDLDRLERDLDAARRRVPVTVVSPPLGRADLDRLYADPAWVPPSLRATCAAPWLDVGVTPAGGVWLCPGHPVGHVDEPFESVFNGAAARRLRRHIAAHGTFPACRACFYGWNYR